MQLRFEDGDLIKQSTECKPPNDDHIVDPIKPGEQTGFVVEVRAGAIDVNSTLPDVIEAHGQRLDFGSRSHAEATRVSCQHSMVHSRFKPHRRTNPMISMPIFLPTTRRQLRSLLTSMERRGRSTSVRISMEHLERRFYYLLRNPTRSITSFDKIWQPTTIS